MLIKLNLKNFANHTDLSLNFSHFNLFYGLDNVGKTNLLEAIHFFSSHFFNRVTTSSDLIYHLKSYASVTAVFDKMNERTKQRFLVQENKISLYHQEKPTNLSAFYGWIPIIYFSETTNLFKNPFQRERFLDLGSRQINPTYNALLQENKQKKIEWKNIVDKKSQKDSFQLCELQKTELLMGEVFYQQTQIQNRFIEMLNKQIRLLLKNEFIDFKMPFKIQFLPWKKLNWDDSSDVFAKKVQKHLLNMRLGIDVAKKQENVLKNNFVFLFLSKCLIFSQSEKKTLELIVQLALANLIQHEIKNDVLFLLDNLFLFDFISQDKIFRILKSLKQFIITTKELSFVSPLLLAENRLKIWQIVKRDV